MSARIVESESSFEAAPSHPINGKDMLQDLQESPSCYVGSGEVVESGTSAITHNGNSKRLTTSSVVHDATKVTFPDPDILISDTSSANNDSLKESPLLRKLRITDSEGTSEDSDRLKLLESALRTIENGKSEKTSSRKKSADEPGGLTESGSDCVSNSSTTTATFAVSTDGSTDKTLAISDSIRDFGGSVCDSSSMNDAVEVSTKSPKYTMKESMSCGTDPEARPGDRVITVRPRVSDLGSSNSIGEVKESSNDLSDERRPYARKMCAYQLSRAAIVDEGCSTDDSITSQHKKVANDSVKTKETGCGFDTVDDDVIKVDGVSGSVIEKNGKVSSGISCAIDPTSLDLEYKIARFVENPDVAEYRFTGKMSPNQRNNIKRIAEESDLIHRVLGKGKDKCIALRKKARFHHRQKVARELKAETKRMKEGFLKKHDLNAVPEKISSFGGVCDSGCGPDGDSGVLFPRKPKGVEICIQTDEDPEEAAKKRPKVKPVKVDSVTQTCPEFYYVCMYCEKDIPEAIKSFHHVQCLREWKARRAASRLEAERQEQLRIQEEEARSLNFRPTGTPHDQARRLIAKENAKKASKKSKQKEEETAAKESKKKNRAMKKSAKSTDNEDANDPFEKIHDNDINGLLNAVKRLDANQSNSSDSAHRDVNGNTANATAVHSAQNEKIGMTSYEKSRLKKHLRERLTILAERRK